MNRNFISLAAALALGSVGLSTAGLAHSELPVTAPPTFLIWSTRVFGGIQDHLSYPQRAGPVLPNQGIVSVKFNCSESGAPADVALYQSSGHGDLDAAALRAVRHVASLHPLPLGVGHDQKYVVRILFSTSENYAREQMVKMRKDAERQNAWLGRSGSNAAMLEMLPPNG